MNYQKSTRQKSSGFTLVELLVVIAIIAVLASLATPMIMKAMVKTKILTTTNICTAIGSAVDRFENDYSYLPFEGTSSPTEDTPPASPIESHSSAATPGFMAVLVGVEKDVNFKKIQYFSLDDPKGASGSYKDGMVVDKSAKSADLYDPWGGPYYLMLDYDLDDEIEHPFETPTKQLHGKSVLIYSAGPDGDEKGKPSSSSSLKELKLIPSNFLK